MDSEFYWNNCDATLNAQEDWEEFVIEVKNFIALNPDCTIKEIMDDVGGDFNDVMAACRKIGC